MLKILELSDNEFKIDMYAYIKGLGRKYRQCSNEMNVYRNNNCEKYLEEY